MSTDVFLARQPIVDAALRVRGYELLFRDGPVNRFPGADPTKASAYVLTAASTSLDLDLVTAGRPAWANVGRELLLSGAAPILPPAALVIEVLEDVQRDADVVASCVRLKALGYQVALDDVVRLDRHDPLLPLADIVKIDWAGSTTRDRSALAAHLRGRTTLLAEKVETRGQFDEARALGCTLFQGYFLSAPVVLQGRRVDPAAGSWFHLLEAVNRPDMDFDEIETRIRADAALTVRLLRLINCAALGVRARINSVGQALVLLGEGQVRRWVTLAALAEGAQGAPAELISTAALRATLCESLGRAAGISQPPFALFLTGMLSNLDVLLSTPMAAALAGLAVPDAVREALLGGPGPLREVMDAVLVWERGDWNELFTALGPLQVAQDRLPTLYSKALEFAGTVAAA